MSRTTTKSERVRQFFVVSAEGLRDLVNGGKRLGDVKTGVDAQKYHRAMVGADEFTSGAQSASALIEVLAVRHVEKKVKVVESRRL